MHLNFKALYFSTLNILDTKLYKSCNFYCNTRSRFYFKHFATHITSLRTFKTEALCFVSNVEHAVKEHLLVNERFIQPSNSQSTSLLWPCLLAISRAGAVYRNRKAVKIIKPVIQDSSHVISN